jgi:putative serine protease PepD
VLVRVGDGDAPEPSAEARAAGANLEQSDQAPPPSSTAELVEEVLPSVVNVRVTGLNSGPFGGQDAEGSGVVIEDGLILTNNHVVAGAIEVEIVFNDETHEPTEGTVIGTAPERDLAVVEVNTEGLTAIEIGRSETLALGDEVVALGFPLGLGGPTVTKGIVSGLDRDISARGPGIVEQLTGLIQTDAAINPGNSGGPLNTAGVAASAAENVGFAIPVDDAFATAQQIIESPAAARPWLGVQAGTLQSATEAGQLGVPSDTRGAVVGAVVPDGPADEAGLQEGDVIVSLAGEEIRSATDLTSVLGDLEVDQEVDVTVVRRSGEVTLTVRLAERPASLG